MLNSEKIKLIVEQCDSKLKIKCKPVRSKDNTNDELGISFDMLSLKSVIHSNFIPISYLIQHTIDNILTELENALFGNKINELIDDCFLSFEDPLYEVIMNRNNPENKFKIHKIYFSEEDIDKINQCIFQYIGELKNENVKNDEE